MYGIVWVYHQGPVDDDGSLGCRPCSNIAKIDVICVTDGSTGELGQTQGIVTYIVQMKTNTDVVVSLIPVCHGTFWPTKSWQL